mmetsp:Transcript_21265/g.58893  ORF Transcript_21265/g.58893 Transcript_21265/m.58893 type:complete len:261 (+) Transcript_21265:864-1646(+)
MATKALHQRRSHWYPQVFGPLLFDELCLPLRPLVLWRSGRRIQERPVHLAPSLLDPPRRALPLEPFISHGSPRTRGRQAHDLARVSDSQYRLWRTERRVLRLGGRRAPPRHRRRRQHGHGIDRPPRGRLGNPTLSTPFVGIHHGHHAILGGVQRGDAKTIQIILCLFAIPGHLGVHCRGQPGVALCRPAGHSGSILAHDVGAQGYHFRQGVSFGIYGNAHLAVLCGHSKWLCHGWGCSALVLSRRHGFGGRPVCPATTGS